MTWNFEIFAMNWRDVRQSGRLQNEVFMFVYVPNDFLRPSEGYGSVRNAPNSCHPARIDEQDFFPSL